MCGICGFVDLKGMATRGFMQASIDGMNRTLFHRGPDLQATWVDEAAGTALGFCRLAILDLSPAGNQPMISADGRCVIVFNGEVYNHAEMRKDLSARGHAFRGHSDTEVMLAAICEWGLHAAVRRFNGMFAFGLWDRKDRCLHLVRDRLGIKPLYYGWLGTTFLFGSELKALRAHPSFNQGIDRDSLALYLKFNYIPAPHTIHPGIHKLVPGSILTIRAASEPVEPDITQFWTVSEQFQQGIADPFKGDEQEAIQMLDAMLKRSIGLRMVADVPLGAFLSGGVDSSTLVALMQSQTKQKVRTFTVGFNQAGYDEARHARLVASHLGTDHTEFYVQPQETLAVIPQLPALYDEPFADASQIPTYLVAKLARQHVTVALSGDGGDELFGGYNRYVLAPRLWKQLGWLPAAVRRLCAGTLRSIPPHRWERMIRSMSRLVPAWRDIPNTADKVQKLADILSASSREGIYDTLVSQWQQPEQVVLGAGSLEAWLGDFQPIDPKGSNAFVEWMMFLDLVTYLPDDILVKVDRASMGVSLEERSPYLDDHEIIAFALRLPLSMKIQIGQGKWILRHVLDKYLPSDLVRRPKMGFAIPIDSWLRGPLRQWAEALLEEGRLAREGFFNPQPIRRKWDEHLAGVHNWQYELWSILMFEAWLDSGGGRR